MNDDTYEKARDPLKRYIASCPVCGSDAELWKCKLGNVTVAVACSNNRPIGPQEDDGDCGCPPRTSTKRGKGPRLPIGTHMLPRLLRCARRNNGNRRPARLKPGRTGPRTPL